MADEDNKEEAPKTDDGAKNQTTKLIIGIALLMVILLGAGFGTMFFLMSSSSPQEETQPIDQSAEIEPEEEAEAEEAEETEEGSEEGSEEQAETEETPANNDDDAQEGSQVKINFGQTTSMKPFYLNLGNPLENRYIRLELAIEFNGGADQLKEVEARKPQLRDAIISVASRKTKEFLLGPDGKDQLRLELLNKINQYMDRKIEAVYITDMIIE